MKIRCPSCDARYTVPEKKLSLPDVRVTCVKCGSKFPVGENIEKNNMGELTGRKTSDGDSALPAKDSDRRRDDGAKGGIDEESSIMSLSPPYPKYRDPLIIAGVILFLLLAIGGIHWAVRGTERSVKGFVDNLLENPVAYVTKLMMGSHKTEMVETFLEQNARVLPELGKDLNITAYNERMGVLSGKKTAVIFVTVEGSRASRDMVFRLEEIDENWRIVEVNMHTGNGRQKRLYP